MVCGLVVAEKSWVQEHKRPESAERQQACPSMAIHSCHCGAHTVTFPDCPWLSTGSSFEQRETHLCSFLPK